MFISIEVEAVEIIEADYEKFFSKHSNEIVRGRFLLIQIERGVWEI